MLIEDHKNRERKRQGWEAVEPSWTAANITAPATTSRKSLAGGLYVSASSWQDAPTGPPKYWTCLYAQR